MESMPTGERNVYSVRKKKVECHLECSSEVISATKGIFLKNPHPSICLLILER